MLDNFHSDTQIWPLPIGVSPSRVSPFSGFVQRRLLTSVALELLILNCATLMFKEKQLMQREVRIMSLTTCFLKPCDDTSSFPVNLRTLNKDPVKTQTF